MEQLRDLVKTTSHDDVKNKVLELIQAWAYAFRNSPKYRAVQVGHVAYSFYNVKPQV
jgi:growth factor-regulated tyrosine kinase substrate